MNGMEFKVDVFGRVCVWLYLRVCGGGYVRVCVWVMHVRVCVCVCVCGYIGKETEYNIDT